jgi:hypothetical protein
LLRGTEDKSPRGEDGRNILRLAPLDVLCEDNRFGSGDTYDLERRRAVSPCCAGADRPVLAITQLHAKSMPVPAIQVTTLSTHVIDYGAHARKKHDTRPSVIRGRSDDCILETGNLQLEHGISRAAFREMESGRGYLQFFGVRYAAEPPESLDGAHAMRI